MFGTAAKTEDSKFTFGTSSSSGKSDNAFDDPKLAFGAKLPVKTSSSDETKASPKGTS